MVPVPDEVGQSEILARDKEEVLDADAMLPVVEAFPADFDNRCHRLLFAVVRSAAVESGQTGLLSAPCRTGTASVESGGKYAPAGAHQMSPGCRHTTPAAYACARL